MNDDKVVVYKVELAFPKDKISITFTGEEVIFHESPTRHRHIRLVNQIGDLIREYVRNNQ